MFSLSFGLKMGWGVKEVAEKGIERMNIRTAGLEWGGQSNH